MVLGYHRENLRAAVSGARQWAFLAASAVAFAGLLIGFRWLQFGLDTSPYAGATLALELQERVFAKSDLQIGRLVASAIVFGFLFVGITRFWVPLRAGLGWLLLPLGQHSLYAYTAHIALALALPLVTERMHLTVSQSPNLSALVQVSSLALIWLAIRFRLLYPTGEMRRWSMLAPVPLAVFMLVTVAREPVPTLVGPAPEAAPASSDATRLARVFGTPVTRQLLQSAAASAPPAPATVPERKVAPSSTPLRAPAVSLHIPSSAGATVNPSSFASAIQARIEGSFLELSFHSAVLDREMSYYAYLPPHYGAAAQHYSVLYMLHGASGSKDEWPSYGLVETVDRLISRAEISPVVVVLPQGDDGYWVNQANNGPRWGDYVTQDVISSVDGTFRTFADADHRAVGGLSMGGAGALQLALNHPNLFRSVGAHSPSLHVDDDTFPILGTGFEFATREPMKLAADAPGIDGLDIWMDAGEQDPWLERDTLLHETLAERGIPHHWSVLEGGHEGPYWQHNLETYVRFYDASLARLGSPGRDAGWSNAGDIPFR
ncbi:MAG: hypothetical protein E6I75_27995 [Chloroflexi bacterium]|nr:MAG: hypothetical protein E6I75_27995 [Chloroflexota bacterium]